jgi:hypothetical protein
MKNKIMDHIKIRTEQIKAIESENIAYLSIMTKIQKEVGKNKEHIDRLKEEILNLKRGYGEKNE